MTKETKVQDIDIIVVNNYAPEKVAGGYGSIIYETRGTGEVVKKIIYGPLKDSYGNKSGLVGLYESLKTLKSYSIVNIYINNRFIIDAFEKNWVKAWSRRSWKKAKNETLMNSGDWKNLYNVMSKHKIYWNFLDSNDDQILECEYLSEKPYRNKT